jgi:hypothetical protein
MILTGAWRCALFYYRMKSGRFAIKETVKPAAVFELRAAIRYTV